MRNFVIASLLFTSASLLTTAQTRKPAAASGQPDVQEASVQTTRFKATNSEFSIYRFVLVWKSTTPPSGGFFYRNGNEWKETTLAKPERRVFGGGPNDYMMVETAVTPDKVKAGDKLIISTHRHDHDDEELPAAVKKMASKGLFYATGSGKNLVWKLIPTDVKVLPVRQQ